MQFIVGGNVSNEKIIDIDVKNDSLLIEKRKGLEFHFRNIEKKPDSTNWLMNYRKYK